MSWWFRLLILAGTAALGVALVIVLVWYYAYRTHHIPPKAGEIPTLTAPAFVHSGANGAVVVEAEDFHDAIRGLGYVQTLHHAWTLASLRQAALGRLAEWFDSDALTADNLVRQLGFGPMAEATASALSTEDRAFLTAFTDGINAAWPRATSRGEFLLFDAVPEPWQIWHVLAVERLYAWLSEPAITNCGPEVLLCEQDQALRDLLKVYGFEHSLAWLSSGAGRTVLYQRHILGASARPVFQEVTIRIAGNQSIRGATLVGLPFFPAGASDSSSWALLLSSPKTIVPAEPSAHRFDRGIDASGNEYLTTFSRTERQLILGDSHEALTWAGFGPGTDAGAWRALLRRKPPRFTLQRGDGIVVDHLQTWIVAGNPQIREPLDDGILIGNSPDAAGIAAYIRTRIEPVPSVELWIRDLYSTLSAQRLPVMLDSLAPTQSVGPTVATALAYLENWDYRYQGYSIGATIFAEWSRHVDTDSTEALTRAVAELTRRFGPDQSAWRWDRQHTEHRYFILPGKLQTGRYAPMSWPGHGHSSTMVWGGETSSGEEAPPVSWEMWKDLSPAAPVYVRRRHIEIFGPLGRYIAEQGSPTVFGLPTMTRHITRLSP